MVLMARVLLSTASLAAAASAAYAPLPPAGLNCGAGLASTQLNLSWSASDGAALYDIELAATEGGPAFLSHTTAATTAQLDDLLAGTSYYTSVRAHASAIRGGGKTQMIIGWSNFSADIKCTTKAAPLASVGTPRRLRREGGLDPAGAGSIALAWDSPAEAGPCALHYRQLGGDRSSGQLPVRAHDAHATLRGLRTAARYAVLLRCEGGETEAIVLRTGDPATMWIEPLRVSENMMTWPDYLANHNSGSLQGDVAFLSGAGAGHFFNFSSSPRVKYCVEVAKVDLSHIARTASGPPEIPTNYSFTEYLSCNGNGRGPEGPVEAWGNYTCICDNHIDRCIAHQTQQQLDELCPQNSSAARTAAGPSPHPRSGNRPSNTCKCNDASVSASLLHTGVMPISLPWSWNIMPRPLSAPLQPFGVWYHHPGHTKCEDDGTPVGTAGCTWRRDERAYMVYGAELLAANWTNFDRGAASTAGIEANVVALQRAYSNLPVTERCCGC